MMLTSAGHRGDAERCRQLGVGAYLLKPIRQSEPREAIARVLGSPHPWLPVSLCKGRKNQARVSQFSLPKITVIALTAHAMKGDQDRCLAAGMDGYLTKPIRPQELDEVLSNQLNARNSSSRPTPVPEPIPGDA
jgi:CheY-like chemotaxis protein